MAETWTCSVTKRCSSSDQCNQDRFAPTEIIVAPQDKTARVVVKGRSFVFLQVPTAKENRTWLALSHTGKLSVIVLYKSGLAEFIVHWSRAGRMATTRRSGTCTLVHKE